MQIYEETQPRILMSLLLLFIAAIAIYQPFFLGGWELRGREDRYAAIALEMNLMTPDTVAHGELVPFNYPLYPWLVALALKIGLPVAFCLRLVSVGSMLLVMVLVWEAGRRACDRQTAAVGAAFYLSTLLVIEKSLDGSPYFTSTLFVFAAWLAWFTYGVARGRWNTAWIISFFFCGLGFFTDGWNAVVIFVVPLIFMRRPMTVWPKLRKPGFFIGSAVLLALILLWVLPHWVLNNQMPFQDLATFIREISGYFKHLFTYPFEVALRLLPWSLLAWPAFCVAYFPLIKNQMFSRFLRTIVISLFILFWFAPTNTSKVVAFIVPPLAILCGINYWLLIRRHGWQMRKFFRFFSILAAVFAVLAIAFYLLPESSVSFLKSIVGDMSFRSSFKVKIFGIIEASLAFVVAVSAVVLSRKSLRVYVQILLLAVSISLSFWSLHIPYRSAKARKRELGAAFAKTIIGDLKLPENSSFPSNLIVFKGPHIRGLYAPCIYMGGKVKKTYSVDSLPDSPDTIYMIATQFPVSKNRTWEYVTLKEKPLVYKNTRLYILKGKRTNVKSLKESDKPSTPTPAGIE